MRTIINKIIFGCLFIFLSWKGFDGLIINFFHSSTDTYDIIQIEQSDNLSSRNIEILNGIAFKDDFIYFESNQYSSVDIVYPLMSSEQEEKYYNSEPINIKVLIRLNNQDRNCLSNGNCIPNDSTTVNGLVKTGLDNLRSGDFESIESELVKFDEDIILLEPNDGPIVWYWNLMMFIGGTLFGFVILKSFFRRASNFEEYWKMVTEKEES
ncbi:hypothetical protein [Reichenbachiella agariperforans]|uniref:hypothetical protein n=1 Tax=Reichenbachiella agariperforans TaxID=156994 RepID=UPI001C0A64D1|nr:hypothetical protein [Reichenbachiella agariperforans]MBU2913541.1 hypothetical protein [Reichenbachiella agariperforans]